VSRIDTRVKQKVKSNYDLVALTLDKPIGSSLNSVLTTRNFTPNHGKMSLVSRYNGASYASRYAVSIDMLKTHQYGESSYLAFNTKSIQVGNGFSGAPIVDETGRVISVVSRTIGCREDVERAEQDAGKMVDHPYPFFAPMPLAFAKFMDIVLDL
jgi:hypothetical protein